MQFWSGNPKVLTVVCPKCSKTLEFEDIMPRSIVKLLGWD